MTISEPSTHALRDAIAALEPRTWLRDYIVAALDDASKVVSIVSFYQRYFDRLILAFDNPEDAELVEFLSSRMRESEEVVNAHVENQRDHLRHTIHDRTSSVPLRSIEKVTALCGPGTSYRKSCGAFVPAFATYWSEAPAFCWRMSSLK